MSVVNFLRVAGLSCVALFLSPLLLLLPLTSCSSSSSFPPCSPPPSDCTSLPSLRASVEASLVETEAVVGEVVGFGDAGEVGLVVEGGGEFMESPNSEPSRPCVWGGDGEGRGGERGRGELNRCGCIVGDGIRGRTNLQALVVV